MMMKNVELKKWGNSQGLRFSKEDLSELFGGEVDENVKLKLIIERGKMIITPIESYPNTMDELFADYIGEPLGEEDRYDWGEPVGRELI
jgi:antitoxin MazE